MDLGTHHDTIAAPATPPGRGGVGIIRISGHQVAEIAQQLLGTQPKPRYAHFSAFLDENGMSIDQGVALYFKAPHSFTGEDVLELQGHGGPVVQDMILQRVLRCGARMARPGEFSERAFLNNKVDLIQAEAIADLIAAGSQQAARSAMQSLQGRFSDEIETLLTKTIELRMYVEAAIDFPEEEIDFLSDGKILKALHILSAQVDQVLKQASQGKALNEGLRVVITGHPNVGKSSLLNALSGENTAIVSNIPGTTRDMVKESITIEGVPLYIIDTAGLRSAQDVIEEEGIQRAWNEMPRADHILLVVDASITPATSEHPLVRDFAAYHDKLTVIRNKIDLVQDGFETDQAAFPIINVSVKSGHGLDVLKAHLTACAGLGGSETTFTARRRHLDSLERVKIYLDEALTQLTVYQAGELVAEALLLAQNALGEVTGAFRSDDLLGKIFSSFCIGK